MVFLAHLTETQNNHHCCRWSSLCGLIVNQGLKTATATAAMANLLTFVNRSRPGKKAAPCKKGPRSQCVGTSVLTLTSDSQAPAPFYPCWGKGPGLCVYFSLVGFVWNGWNGLGKDTVLRPARHKMTKQAACQLGISGAASETCPLSPCGALLTSSLVVER